MYSGKKRKESKMYAWCQKYEELYFDSLDIKIKDIVYGKIEMQKKGSKSA